MTTFEDQCGRITDSPVEGGFVRISRTILIRGMKLYESKLRDRGYSRSETWESDIRGVVSSYSKMNKPFDGGIYTIVLKSSCQL